MSLQSKAFQIIFSHPAARQGLLLHSALLILILFCMNIVKIRGVVKNYAWGNRNFIPSLIGGYDGKPQAELWLGGHSSGDADVNGERLSSFIFENREYLGSEDWAKYSGRLPFLMKVLAIEKPLSLQCHPSRAQAELGWKREEGLRKAGKEVSYQDDNEKCEMILALSPISALCGFRAIEEIRADLSRVIPESYEAVIKPFSDSLEHLFKSLFSLDQPIRQSILSELGSAVSPCSSFSDGFLTREGIVKECLEEYEGDIGSLFPYLMNIVHLSPGEAMAIRPGTLHAYVLGNGIEVMNDSDNVLRGGLTKKRVDLDELCSIMDFSPLKVEKCSFMADSHGRRLYSSPSDKFSLLSVSSGKYDVSGEKISIAIVTEGKITFSSGLQSLALEKGEAALIDAGEKYEMTVDGKAFISELPN